MSVPEAAKVLKITSNGVVARIMSGKLLAKHFNGRAWMLSRRSVEGKPINKSDWKRICKRYLTVPEACEILGVTDSYVVRLIQRGILPAIRLNGKAWAVDSEATEANAKQYRPSSGQPRQPGRKHVPTTRLKKKPSRVVSLVGAKSHR